MNFSPRVLLWVVCLCAVLLPAANAQMLNSERIEQTFGSYGIEVLYADWQHRVSNLFSEEDGIRTTRTLAVVLYPEEGIPPELTEIDRRIRDGESIGATFQAAGWTVGKRLHTLLNDVQLPETARRLLEIAEGEETPAHYYSLVVSQGGADDKEPLGYAGIFEVHHPDYLTADELRGIYGPWGELPPPLEDLFRAQLQSSLALLDSAQE